MPPHPLLRDPWVSSNYPPVDGSGPLLRHGEVARDPILPLLNFEPPKGWTLESFSTRSGRRGRATDNEPIEGLDGNAHPNATGCPGLAYDIRHMAFACPGLLRKKGRRPGRCSTPAGQTLEPSPRVKPISTTLRAADAGMPPSKGHSGRPSFVIAIDLLSVIRDTVTGNAIIRIIRLAGRTANRVLTDFTLGSHVFKSNGHTFGDA